MQSSLGRWQQEDDSYQLASQLTTLGNMNKDIVFNSDDEKELVEEELFICRDLPKKVKRNANKA